MLAYRPGLPVSFNVPLCVLSFILSIAATAIAFTIRIGGYGTKTSIIACVLVLAAGVGALHFVGMRSVRMTGVIQYDTGLVVLSLSLGALCATIAILLLARGAAGWASVFLTLAVVLTQFIAKGSVSPELVGGVDVMPFGTPQPDAMKVTIGASFHVLALVFAGSTLDQQVTNRLADEVRGLRALGEGSFKG